MQIATPGIHILRNGQQNAIDHYVRMLGDSPPLQRLYYSIHKSTERLIKYAFFTTTSTMLIYFVNVYAYSCKITLRKKCTFAFAFYYRVVTKLKNTIIHTFTIHIHKHMKNKMYGTLSYKKGAYRLILIYINEISPYYIKIQTTICDIQREYIE